MTEKHPIVLPLKWHPKSEDQAHDGSIYFEPIKGHAYAVAMQPRYVSDEDWKAYCDQIIRAMNGLPEAIAALEPFSDMFLEGSEDLADDVGITCTGGRTSDFTLTIGDFRRIRAALTKLKG